MEQLIPIDGEFTVTCTSVKSKLHSEPACQSIVKKAIVEKLREFYDVEAFRETRDLVYRKGDHIKGPGDAYGGHQRNRSP